MTATEHVEQAAADVEEAVEHLGRAYTRAAHDEDWAVATALALIQEDLNIAARRLWDVIR